MRFNVSILGSNSAAPASERNPSSQIVNINEELFLIDCGEGTQMQLRKYKIKYQKINNIFISHLHGDHYLGLVGLIFTYHLLGREKALNVYGTDLLEEIINLQLKASNCQLVYPLNFRKIEHKVASTLYEDEKVIVENIPLKHSIPTSGFLFKEKPAKKNINMEKLKGENLEHSDYENIKNGKDFINSKGKIFKNVDITFNQKSPRSYAYCSDTMYDEKIIQRIKNTDLLYFESTFMGNMQETAIEKFHSTTIDAGRTAKLAEVKKLLLGHFSSRYDNEHLHLLLSEAKNVFENTELAMEGKTYEV